MTVVMVAPNGARLGKADHPALPLTVEEIVEAAVECAAAGADAIHLHVRDADGRPSLDPGRYREALDGVREATGGRLMAQVSTETVGGFGPDDVARLLKRLRPEAASLALRDLAPKPEDQGAARALVAWAQEAGVGLQHILYAPQDLGRLAGVLPDVQPPAMLFVLGRYQEEGPSDPRTVLGFLAAAEAAGWGRAPWMVCAFGAPETRVLAAAAALGGQCRVGFENNLLNVDGVRAASNAERVAALRAALASIGLPPAPDRRAVDQALGRDG